MRILQKTLIAVSCAVLSSMVMGCASEQDAPTVEDSVEQVSDSVTAKTVIVHLTTSDTFSPSDITVRAGDTVKFINDDADAHTVTSGLSSNAADMPGSRFDTRLAHGKSVRLRFNLAGDKPFFCRFHESLGMKGVVHVVKKLAHDDRRVAMGRRAA